MRALLRTCLAWALLTGALGWGGPAGLGAETRVITDMELYNTVYRGERTGTTWDREAPPSAWSRRGIPM